MSNTKHRNYFLARAQTARGLAETAISSEVRSIHLRMAQDYELLAAQVEEAAAYQLNADQRIMAASIATSRDAIQRSSDVLHQTSRMVGT